MARQERAPGTPGRGRLSPRVPAYVAIKYGTLYGHGKLLCLRFGGRGEWTVLFFLWRGADLRRYGYA